MDFLSFSLKFSVTCFLPLSLFCSLSFSRIFFCSLYFLLFFFCFSFFFFFCSLSFSLFFSFVHSLFHFFSFVHSLFHSFFLLFTLFLQPYLIFINLTWCQRNKSDGPLVVHERVLIGEAVMLNFPIKFPWSS